MVKKLGILPTVKPVQNGHSQKDRKLIFRTNYRLMQVKSIAECSKGSILQYFRPVITLPFGIKIFVFCLFLSVLFRQVLLNSEPSQAHCIQGEHFAILLTFIKLPFGIKIFILSIFEWLFYTCFTVYHELRVLE